MASKILSNTLPHLPHKTVLPLPPGIIIPIVKLRKEKQKGFKKLAEDHTVIK